GKTETSVYKVFVAESADGISFENNQVALDPTIEGSRLGTYPDGHAVAYLPGRNPTPEDPFTERPFIMYFRDKSGQGIAYAESADGYAFFEVPDDLNTVEIEGLIRISGVPEGATFSAQPTHVLQLAQNDLRMWAFRDNTGIQYLVSPNGIDWQLIEDPVLNVGSLGPDGSWNDERNYYASAAYVGQGKFILARSGRSKTGEQLYRTGISFGQSAFYQENDIGKWAHLSPMNDWQSEGWAPYTSSANNPDGVTTALINNGDGTVSVRDRKESGNFYMVHDAALTVPFTFEFRARLDYATGTGADTDHPKYMVGAFINDPLHPGGEAWQPAFAASRFGGWALATDPSAETDNTQFQTFTVVCKFDEGARAQLAINSGNSTANVNLCVYEVFLNRDFSAPKVVYHNTGFFGWGDVDLDGRIDIGFPGPSAGQVTVDWIRWGNGVIHDPQDPPSAPPVLAITKVANGVRLDWTGGGVLQSAQSLGGAWQDETGVSSGAVLPITNTQKFYRVRQ
ncbi:MAG TPA: hypothetical protein PLW35_02085, partial [Verrucomicrobiota bacterium]|nr:hypothetical protein [Verrucomicrobiota bacterium]